MKKAMLHSQKLSDWADQGKLGVLGFLQVENWRSCKKTYVKKIDR